MLLLRQFRHHINELFFQVEFSRLGSLVDFDICSMLLLRYHSSLKTRRSKPLGQVVFEAVPTVCTIPAHRFDY